MKPDIMCPTVYYFEIPVSDLERAITFYSAVFGCEFDRVEVDGNQMANFPSLDGGAGASGALAKGNSWWLKPVMEYQSDRIDASICC